MLPFCSVVAVICPRNSVFGSIFGRILIVFISASNFFCRSSTFARTSIVSHHKSSATSTSASLQPPMRLCLHLHLRLCLTLVLRLSQAPHCLLRFQTHSLRVLPRLTHREIETETQQQSSIHRFIQQQPKQSAIASRLSFLVISQSSLNCKRNRNTAILRFPSRYVCCVLWVVCVVVCCCNCC